MASAMKVFRKFKSSDGRIKVATLSGVSALVAVIALLVGVLPVFASHDGDHPLVEPELLTGNPDCTMLNTDDYLFEHKINNPADGTTTVGPLVHGDLSGTLTIEVYKVQGNEQFDFSFTGDFDASAVIVKGGSDANLYDYLPSGTIEDEGLHAPLNPKNNKFYEVSHISFCVGEAPTLSCDTPLTLLGTLPGDKTIIEVTAEIFANSLHDCTDKDAVYTLEDDVVTLRFDGDGTEIAAGRLDFTKDFGTSPEPLEYDRDDDGNFQDVQWCDIRTKDTTPDENGLFDGNEFDDVLETDEYPSLLGVTDTDNEPATACKVYEEENAAGDQHTVVYFEFVDPRFR